MKKVLRESRFMVITVFILLLIFFLLAVCDSRYNIKVSEYELEFESLPPEFDGFTVVQLSDLHGMCFGRENEKLAEKVMAERPDLIAMTGDFAGSSRELHSVRSLLGKLDSSIPAFYVSGNHEWAGHVLPQIQEIMCDAGVQCLENRYMTVSRDGAEIVLAGVTDPKGPAGMLRPDELAAQIREKYPNSFVLLLGHRNYWLQKYPQLPVDLILCGHAHGGIVRLPLIGGLLNNNHSFIAEYEKGVYQGENYRMAVSCGLGNSILIPRLFNRPELVKIILRAGQS